MNPLIMYAELQIIYHLDDFSATDGKLTTECHAEITSMHLDYIIKFLDELIAISLHSE